MFLSYIITSVALSLVPFGFAWRENISCGDDMDPCPRNMVCVPNDSSCTDMEFCEGTCSKKYSSCGGYTMNPKWCNSGSSCLEDPRFPDMYGLVADLPGICVSNTVQTCDEIGGLGCPRGKRCYDDPRDDCYPFNGDTYCSGICL